MNTLISSSIKTVADLKPGYMLGAADVALLQEMARRLLAAEAQEPVAYLYSASFERGHVEGELTDAPGCDMPVYAAPQPVVVPDELEPVAVAWLVGDGIILNPETAEACRAAMLKPTPLISEIVPMLSLSRVEQPVGVPDELLYAMEEVLRISDRDHEAWHRARDGIAACRAAMLNAEPVSQPYMLPQWIPCSERMPEAHEPIYIFHPDYGVDQGVWYDDHENSFLWDSDTSRCRATQTVSHWMAMPALPSAPQEPTK